MKPNIVNKTENELSEDCFQYIVAKIIKKNSFKKKNKPDGVKFSLYKKDKALEILKEADAASLIPWICKFVDKFIGLKGEYKRQRSYKYYVYICNEIESVPMSNDQFDPICDMLIKGSKYQYSANITILSSFYNIFAEVRNIQKKLTPFKKYF
jgi:hypothetical protein